MNRHPLNRKVFFVLGDDEFLSVNEVRRYAQTDKLALTDWVFDVDGERYTAGSIADGKAPFWAMTAENDPALHALPPLTESDIAMADALASEDGFLEMPAEPPFKTVKDFLASEPRIARMVGQVSDARILPKLPYNHKNHTDETVVELKDEKQSDKYASSGKYNVGLERIPAGA